MSWVQNIDKYGNCIVLNKDAELEPVKCDSNHNTICFGNNLLLNNTKNTDTKYTQKKSRGNGMFYINNGLTEYLAT